MISFGGRARACNVSVNLSVVQLTTRHFLSSNSRIVCTCGRISLPLGAWISCGMTRRTRSFSAVSSPVMLCWPKSEGSFSRIACRICSIPISSFALTSNGRILHSSSMYVAKLSLFSLISILFNIGMTGISFSFNSASISFSWEKVVSPHSSNAISVFSIAFKVRLIRSSPSSPSSSNPGVSINKHGPIPCISIALDTRSVVVPGVSETRAVSCPVNALIREDLPLFRLPKRAIWSLLAFGVSVRLISENLFYRWKFLLSYG